MSAAPMVIEYPGVRLELTPETVGLNDLVTVHACLTRSVVHAFQAHDREAMPDWLAEMFSALLGLEPAVIRPYIVLQEGAER